MLSHLRVSRATKPGYYGDGGGLWVQVSPSGSQSWVFRFSIAKKQREMGLGAVRTVSLDEARAKARECRQALLKGRDPLEVRKATRMAEALQRARMMTFGQCAAANFLTCAILHQKRLTTRQGLRPYSRRSMGRPTRWVPQHLRAPVKLPRGT